MSIDHEITVQITMPKVAGLVAGLASFDKHQKEIIKFNERFCSLASKHKGFWIDRGWLSPDENKESARIMKYDIVFSFVSSEGLTNFKKEAEKLNVPCVSLALK